MNAARHQPHSPDRLLLPQPLERFQVVFTDAGAHMEKTGLAMSIDDDIVKVKLFRPIDCVFDPADQNRGRQHLGRLSRPTFYKGSRPSRSPLHAKKRDGCFI
jgi:hypothetical protein